MYSLGLLAVLSAVPAVDGATDILARAPPLVVEPGLLPVTAALVPGALVHGAGLWAAGDSDGGLRLLATQGAGLGLMAVGGVPLILTGASRYLAGPSVALTLTGFGLFLLPWFADLYGAAGGPRIAGRADSAPPNASAQVSTAYLSGPQTLVHALLGMNARWRIGDFTVSPTLWAGLDQEHLRVDLDGGWRLLGADGSWLALEAELRGQQVFGRDFTFATMAVAAAVRLDGAVISTALAGSFYELRLGLGANTLLIPQRRTTWASESLARFAFGLYLGQARATGWGELSLYYDHRHDDWAGGLSFNTVSDGVLGYVGLRGAWWLDERWGLEADVAVGSAVWSAIGLRYAWSGT